jgi:hypothetical protein
VLARDLLAARPRIDPGRIDEIKHDGYRLIDQCGGKPLRTTGAIGFRRYIRGRTSESKQLVRDGRSDFNGLHSRRHYEFYASDKLVSNGQDLRKLPLSRRQANLARLMVRARLRSWAATMTARRRVISLWNTCLAEPL